MNWINQLIFGQGIGHSIFLLSVIIALGIKLGKIKIFGVSLGATFVLFVGIVLGHFGFKVNPEILSFFKIFGLILFVYAVGMQVGPGFFPSLKKGGLTMNALACLIIFLGVGIALAIHYIARLDIPVTVGILSGAVTNTPGLGAAQQAFTEVTGQSGSEIALGYAVAYPLGVVGIILSMIVIKHIFHINLNEESEKLKYDISENEKEAMHIALSVQNPAIFGKKIKEISKVLENCSFVISRIWRNGSDEEEMASCDSVLYKNDNIYIITTERDVAKIKSLIGTDSKIKKEEWLSPSHSPYVYRKVRVTKNGINGKSINEMKLRQLYGVTVTRISRSGIELVAANNLKLQMGDKLTVVGEKAAIEKVINILGDSARQLNTPNLIQIFMGIALGVILGSIPIPIPGIPQPVKLGLAGGPLVVAIIISSFGYKFHLITYATQSATLMIREIGITIFLACVGLGAGAGFVDTIVNKGGYLWVGYGFAITVLPLLITGFIARYFCKLNYFSILGLLSGSMTDPPALAYGNEVANGNDAPSIGYATVYPVTMFMRVLTAQLLILLFL
ncbi:MAG: putative transporter [Bacteroidales bacterium]|jgi:putative transport protein|nr:putative transporter [Bacteroidales bacterium]